MKNLLNIVVFVFIFVSTSKAQQNTENSNFLFRSTPSTTEAVIKFTNNSGVSYDLFWVDWDGRKVFWTTIPPGFYVNQPTFINHLWCLQTKKHQEENVFILYVKT